MKNLLSIREQEVLREVINGATNMEIAEILHLSIHTVKVYVRSIIKKLEAKNRVDIAVKGLYMMDVYS